MGRDVSTRKQHGVGHCIDPAVSDGCGPNLNLSDLSEANASTKMQMQNWL